MLCLAIVTLINIFGYALMDVEISIFVKGDFIAIENVKPTTNRPKVPCEYVTLFIYFVSVRD